MQHARWNQPASARLESVGFRQIQQPIFALVPAVKTVNDILLGGAWFQPHECIWKIVPDRVHLGWEVVALGLSFLADFCRLFRVLVHVMRDRAHVVEELRIHRPFFERIPDVVTDDFALQLGHGIAQQEPFPVVNHV